MHWASAKDSNTWHLFKGPKADASRCGNVKYENADHAIVTFGEDGVAAAGGICCLTCRKRSKVRTFTPSFVDHISELRPGPVRPAPDYGTLIRDLRTMLTDPPWPAVILPAVKVEELPAPVRAPLGILSVFRRPSDKITVHFLKKRDGRK